jgi:hypothetical protein
MSNTPIPCVHGSASFSQKLPSTVVLCEGSRPPITSIWPCPMTWQKWFARRASVGASAWNQVNEGTDKINTSRYPGSSGLAISAVGFVEPPNTYLQIGSQLALKERGGLGARPTFRRSCYPPVLNRPRRTQTAEAVSSRSQFGNTKYRLQCHRW